jgi:hypothetical protein
LSTLAIDGSSGPHGGRRAAASLRYLDLLLLVLALPVFLLFGFSLLGYAVCAGAWLVGRAIHLAAERHVARSLASGNRRSALGAMAAATLGRVWLVALAILLVGLAEREAGLAGAVLAAALVTVHLGARAVERLLAPEGTT